MTASISFLKVGHCITKSISCVLISGVAGFSCNKVREMSVVAAWHNAVGFYMASNCIGVHCHATPPKQRVWYIRSHVLVNKYTIYRRIPAW